MGSWDFRWSHLDDCRGGSRVVPPPTPLSPSRPAPATKSGSSRGPLDGSGRPRQDSLHHRPVGTDGRRTRVRGSLLGFGGALKRGPRVPVMSPMLDWTRFGVVRRGTGRVPSAPRNGPLRRSGETRRVGGKRRRREASTPPRAPLGEGSLATTAPAAGRPAPSHDGRLRLVAPHARGPRAPRRGWHVSGWVAGRGFGPCVRTEVHREDRGGRARGGTVTSTCLLSLPLSFSIFVFLCHPLLPPSLSLFVSVYIAFSFVLSLYPIIHFAPLSLRIVPPSPLPLYVSLL